MLLEPLDGLWESTVLNWADCW